MNCPYYPATGHRPPATGNRPPATGHRPPTTGNRNNVATSVIKIVPCQRVTLSDGDTIVVIASEPLTDEAVKELLQALEESFPGVRALILDAALNIGYVQKTQIKVGAIHELPVRNVI